MTPPPNLWRRLAVLAGLIVVLAALHLAPAAIAAGAPRCAGSDLIDKLARDDPAGYEALLAAAAEVPAGDHLLWRIEGENGRPDSFLFGTIHYSDDRATDLSAAVRSALAGARAVALELAGVPQPGELQAALRDNPELVAMPADKSLFDLLAPAAAAALKQKLTASGVDPDQAARLKPWFVTILLGTPECERRRQAAGALPVDGVIIEIAGASDTPVVGLETLAEQLAIMASMPLGAQAAQLAQLVTAAERPEDRYETLLQLYLDRRIGMMFPMMELQSRKDAELGKAVRHMTETLVARRNATMIERALPLIEDGGVVIAVGSLHLPGPQGLVELLRARGYKVSPAD
jgi:uncharacterized protein YbaP (TraB family)